MDDIDRIVEAVTATAEVMGQQMTATAIALIAEDLSEYPIADVDKALRRVRRECQRFSLAAVIERLPNGWPGPEEAWASFPKSEEDTGVVTQEALRAWGIAEQLWEHGDKVGARMAFKEAYQEAVAQADMRTPQWQVSLGWDVKKREEPIKRAIEQGLISYERVQHILPAPEDCGPIAGLLTGKVSSMPVTEDTKRRLTELRKMLADSQL